MSAKIKVHSFIRYGSYSTERGWYETKFKVLRGISPQRCAEACEDLIKNLDDESRNLDRAKTQTV